MTILTPIPTALYIFDDLKLVGTIMCLIPEKFMICLS